MLAARRSAATSTRRAHASLYQQPRHFSNSSKHNTTHPETSTEHAEAAGHHGGPTGQHSLPVNESLGKGFYITIATLSLSFAIYKFSRSTDGSSADSAQPLLTRIISSYSDYKEKWAARNTLHTAMIEQAAFDRNLFHNSRPSAHVDLKFPEIFNTGSPWNVPAGHGGANLDALIAHYEKKNAEDEERKMKRLKEGKKEPSPDLVRRGTY
ncbi:MAG: hypothetical protein M1812_001528 [Candelaria pacifica]|nr:MAG: hypothetical protein M1812_001528 [Candelaria pacifica]